MHKNTYLTTFLLCLFGYETYRRKWRVYSKESTENGKLVVVEPGLEIPNLPLYSMEQVSKHNNAENGIWIVYKAGVYDVSQFVKIHPGGDNILLETGNSIEPFRRCIVKTKRNKFLNY